MISGETVYVYERTGEQVADPFGFSAHDTTRVAVDNVLVHPFKTADELGSNRPDGISVDLVLHFPKSYTGDLRGLVIEVRGVDYDVIGSPERYENNNTPGNWNMSVDAVRRDG